jgi:Cys-tRNA(Pro)/Cys-tRNA(Cys) deacylase
VRQYAHDPRASSYGVEAAAAMGVSADRVFKTLIASVDGQLVVAVVPVSGQLNLKALAEAVGGKKAEMAQTAAAERATGYVTGGISPIAQRKVLPVVIDSSASGFETVFCSAGQRGLEVELAPDDLILATGATVASIARPGNLSSPEFHAPDLRAGSSRCLRASSTCLACAPVSSRCLRASSTRPACAPVPRRGLRAGFPAGPAREFHVPGLRAGFPAGPAREFHVPGLRAGFPAGACARVPRAWPACRFPRMGLRASSTCLGCVPVSPQGAAREFDVPGLRAGFPAGACARVPRAWPARRFHVLGLRAGSPQGPAREFDVLGLRAGSPQGPAREFDVPGLRAVSPQGPHCARVPRAWPARRFHVPGLRASSTCLACAPVSPQEPAREFHAPGLRAGFRALPPRQLHLSSAGQCRMVPSIVRHRDDGTFTRPARAPRPRPPHQPQLPQPPQSMRARPVP